MIAVLAAVAVPAVLAVLLTNPSISTIGAKPREVEVMMVVRQSGSAGGIVLTAGGYIVPRHRVDVASKISGRVEDVLFEKGDFVKKGQVLARPDDREYRVQLAQARANRDAAAARLNEAVAGSRPQEIERARATLEQAEANLRTAEINLDRARRLNRSGVFVRQALDDAQNAYDVAAAQMKVARENHELARLRTRKEQVELARAQLAEAEASIRWFETQLENTVIRAPVDGTVLDRMARWSRPGSSAGGRGPKPGVSSLANLKELEVELDINEADIPRVRPGQQCSVSPDSYPDRKYKTVVREIAPEANRQKAPSR